MTAQLIKKNRAKGLKVEREIEEFLNSNGMDAKLQPLSGKLEGKKNDIIINDIISGEIKSRKNFADHAMIEKCERDIKERGSLLPALIKQTDGKRALIEMYLQDFRNLFFLIIVLTLRLQKQ